MDVYLQMMGPKDTGTYDWITIGVIEDPESLDIDYLTQEARKQLKRFMPQIDVLRLVVMINGITEMKIFIDGFFRQEMH